MHIIYGFLDKPLASLEQLNLSQIHTGVQRVLMLRPDTPSPTLPPDVQTLDVVAPNVIIPNQETTYWCFIQKLPDNMPKNHIVMVETPLKMETLNIRVYLHTVEWVFLDGDRAQAAIIAPCLPAGSNKTRAALSWFDRRNINLRKQHD